jgi:hypothetical protein
MQQVASLTQPLGQLGDDLALGRRAIKGGMGALGGIAIPWLARRILGKRAAKPPVPASEN